MPKWFKDLNSTFPNTTSCGKQQYQNEKTALGKGRTALSTADALTSVLLHHAHNKDLMEVRKPHYSGIVISFSGTYELFSATLCMEQAIKKGDVVQYSTCGHP